MKGSPLAFLVLVRARIGQVCAGHGSKVVEGRKLYKLKSGISVHLYLSLSNFVTLSLSVSLCLCFVFWLCFCLRLSSSVLTNVLLAQRSQVFRLQKLCGNGSDKRKTTIEWMCVRNVHL